MEAENGGHWDRTAGALITGLKSCKGDTGAVFGDYDTRCGMWVRFNPMDGKGAKNENVADYRYALLESDRLEIGKQIDIIKKLELPVAALVHSGNKSVHAIVRIDAPDYDEYRKRVDFLYKVAQKNGFVVDNANRNPSRLSRMPGCWRNGRKQWLIGTNLGKANWEEWQEWFETVNDDLPDQESLASVWDFLPELAPPLIDGVLRQGHKMIISGPSKAGKSFLLIELAISIAEGLDWVGRLRCAQGRILYVNLELDRASCFHRFRDVYAAMQIPAAHIGNIDIWNLRGKSLPMDKLAPKLIRRARDKGYLAVIIDPIYKVITGDENSAEQMAHFCNQFDKICAELSCATIYCHHHSKGAQGLKNPWTGPAAPAFSPGTRTLCSMLSRWSCAMRLPTPCRQRRPPGACPASSENSRSSNPSICGSTTPSTARTKQASSAWPARKAISRTSGQKAGKKDGVPGQSSRKNGSARSGRPFPHSIPETASFR